MVKSFEMRLRNERVEIVLIVFRALHFAAGIPGATDVLELLLMYGAELDATDDEGNTALFCATQTNNMFVASILIGQGASIKTKNLQG